MDKRKPILEIGIIVLLILITAAIMNYPINIRGLEFWLFIIIALFYDSGGPTPCSIFPPRWKP